ncbi:MAG: SAM-dependent methyltransferase [Gammaproteobacteria bacterium]|nr:SAM-dependent methyltransferase [Chromatiales bacterium]MDP6675581.1 SAM-dependent methyltransferase [Gammaproteobacteria bacterium]
MTTHLNTVRTLMIMVCTLVLSGGTANAWTVDDLSSALSNATRSAPDMARDEARKPAAVLVFAGVEPGMSVLDVMSAGGWYSEVLATAVGPDGTVYAENPAWLIEAMEGRVVKALASRLADNRLPNVVRVDEGLDKGTIAAGSIDIALTALNMHDTFDRFGRNATLEQMSQIYTALKPGGIFILIDHSGKAGPNNKQLHRIEQHIMEGIALEAGFTLEAKGQMLKHPEDDLTKMVFAKGLRGNTDRFVLKLRKH